VSYSALTGDLTNANYGSLRDGSLKERDAYKKEQNWISVQLYRRVYLRWMKFAMLSRRSKAADQERRALHLAQLARARLAVDRSAERTSPRPGWKSHTASTRARQICAANGRDFETNVETLAHEEDLADPRA
jgi:capsid protein